MENYIQYTTMGVVPRIRMRPGCLPTKFADQPKRTATGTSTGVRRSGISKKLRQALKKEYAEEITVTFQHENLNIEVLGQNEGLLDEEQKLPKIDKSAQDADVSGTVRAGRGRPRKKIADPISENLQKGQEAVVSGTVRAGRGRPRKTHTYSIGEYLQTKQDRSEFAENSGDVFEPGTSYSSVEPLGSGYVDDPGALSPSASEESTNGNEIKVFCPKCNTEVSHTAEGIQQDQTKILIAKVYRYFEQEYEELKLIYGDMDLTPLSKVCERTALATGVSEAMLMQILKEEERRNEERQREPPQKERAARKRRRQTTHSSSEEDSSDDNVEDIEQPSPKETLVVKIEPPEYNIDEPEIFMVKVEPSDGDGDTNKKQTDPIALDLKPEQQDDDDELNTDATPAPETSADTKRKAKKTPRLCDETSLQQQTQAECSTSAASRSKRRETEESPLPGEVEIKIEEEGFS